MATIAELEQQLQTDSGKGSTIAQLELQLKPPASALAQVQSGAPISDAAPSLPTPSGAAPKPPATAYNLKNIKPVKITPETPEAAAARKPNLETGQLAPGNINTQILPPVRNEDGSVSTVRSIGIGVDGKTILIPTVINGKVVSNDEAIKSYQKTGAHLGEFDSPENATKFAERLHEREAQRVGSEYQPGPFGRTLLSTVDALKAGKAGLAGLSKNGPLDDPTKFISDLVDVGHAGLAAFPPVIGFNLAGQLAHEAAQSKNPYLKGIGQGAKEFLELPANAAALLNGPPAPPEAFDDPEMQRLAEVNKRLYGVQGDLAFLMAIHGVGATKEQARALSYAQEGKQVPTPGATPQPVVQSPVADAAKGALRSALMTKISETYTPEQLREIYSRVTSQNQMPSTPEEQQLISYLVRDRFPESPQSPMRQGVQYTEQNPRPIAAKFPQAIQDWLDLQQSKNATLLPKKPQVADATPAGPAATSTVTPPIVEPVLANEAPHAAALRIAMQKGTQSPEFADAFRALNADEQADIASKTGYQPSTENAPVFKSESIPGLAAVSPIGDKAAALTPEQIAEKAGAKFNGPQIIPGLPDQWVFTDKTHGGTTYVPANSTPEHVASEMARVRANFEAAKKPVAGNPITEQTPSVATADTSPVDDHIALSNEVLAFVPHDHPAYPILSGEKPLRLTMDTNVGQMLQTWDEIHHAAAEVDANTEPVRAKALADLAALKGQRGPGIAEKRKALQEKIIDSHGMSEAIRQAADANMQGEQAKLRAVIDKQLEQRGITDADVRESIADNFFEDTTQRPGIEQTYKMTYAEVLEHLIRMHEADAQAQVTTPAAAATSPDKPAVSPTAGTVAAPATPDLPPLTKGQWVRFKGGKSMVGVERIGPEAGDDTQVWLTGKGAPKEPVRRGDLIQANGEGKSYAGYKPIAKQDVATPVKHSQPWDTLVPSGYYTAFTNDKTGTMRLVDRVEGRPDIEVPKEDQAYVSSLLKKRYDAAKDKFNNETENTPETDGELTNKNGVYLNPEIVRIPMPKAQKQSQVVFKYAKRGDGKISVGLDVHLGHGNMMGHGYAPAVDSHAFDTKTKATAYLYKQASEFLAAALVHKDGYATPSNIAKTQQMIDALDKFAGKTSEPQDATASAPAATGGSLTAAQALHAGEPVKLPAGANAVLVTTDAGKYAKAIVKDFAMLKGAGPYNKVEPISVKFKKGGVPDWNNAVMVNGKITVPASAKPQAAPVVKPARTFKAKYTPDAFADHPLVHFVIEQGGMMSKSAARKLGKYEGQESLWDNPPKLSHPSHNKIYKAEGGRLPDQVAQAAYDAHLIEQPSVESLNTELSNASAGARRTKASEQSLKEQDQEHATQTQAFRDEALVKGSKKDKPVKASDLNMGDTVEVRGEPLTVTDINPQTHDVTLQDGRKYGVQTVTDSDVIYAERVDTAQHDDAFGLESATDEQLQTESEKAAQKKKLEEGLRKPLVGGAIDTTGDLLDETKSDNPLFSQKPKPVVKSSIDNLSTEKQAEYAKLKAELIKKLGQVNSGIDPDIMTLAGQMAKLHVESGVKTFKEFAGRMKADLPQSIWDKIKTYLRNVWNQVADMLGLDDASRAHADEVLAELDRVQDETGAPEYKGEGAAPGNSDRVEYLGETYDKAQGGGKRGGGFVWRKLTKGSQFKASEWIEVTDKALIETLDSALPVDSITSKAASEMELDEPGLADAEIRALINSTDGPGRRSANIRKMAEARGLTVKAMQETIESELVKMADEIASDASKSPREVFDAMVDLYDKQPTLTARTSTSVRNQAYSTPLPLAYLSGHMIDLQHAGSVYEPTAGNGALVIGVDKSKVTVNEIDPARVKALRDAGFTDVTERDAAKFKPQGEYDAVVTNPPFGGIETTNYEGFKINRLEHIIALKALEALNADGRGTMILGANREAGSIGAGADSRFFNYLYGHYNVVGNFEVSGDLYGKQGAKWPVRVVVVDGRRANPEIAKLSPTSVDRLSTWDEVYKRAEEIRNEIDQRKALSTGGTGEISDRRETRTEAADESGAIPVKSGGDNSVAGTTVKPPGARSGTGAVSGPAPSGVSRAPAGEGIRGPADAVRSDVQPPTGGKPVAGVAGPSEGIAGVQSGSELAGGSPAGSERADAGVIRKPAPRVAGTDHQVPYETRSEGGEPFGTLIPNNVANGVHDALDALIKRVGPLDDYLADKLNLTKTELYKGLAAEQIDGASLAIDQIERGGALVVGDEPGIGKGRQAAAVIRYAVLAGKVPIFFTQDPKLFSDMNGDLMDIGTTVKPFILGDPSKASIVDAKNNVIHKAPNKAGQDRTMAAILKDGLQASGYDSIFLTYSQVNNQNARQKFLEKLAGDNDSIVIMDEAHNAAGDASSSMQAAFITGGTVKRGSGADQKKIIVPGLLNAAGTKQGRGGVVYLSATYAKRPDNMPVYFRTDLRKAAQSFAKIVQAMKTGGVALQQAVSESLAKVGQYLRRERDFTGVPYTMERVKTADDAKLVQDVDAATDVLQQIKEFSKAIRAAVAADTEGDATSTARTENQMAMTDFASIVHNQISQLLLAAKADAVVEKAIASHKAGQKPVIALMNTMESFLSNYVEDKGIKVGQPIKLRWNELLEYALSRSLRITEEDAQGNSHISYADPAQYGLAGLYAQVQEAAQELDINFPVSPIDYILQKLEASGVKMGELTGRTSGIKYTNFETGEGVYHTFKKVNKNTLVNDFNGGNLDGMLLNASGSTGLSAHAAFKFADRRPRHMIIAQPALDINVFVQTLGRIKRTGMIPGGALYTHMVLPLQAELRPAAIASRKMKSLNANTTADAEGSVKIDSIDFINKYGDAVIAEYLDAYPQLQSKLDLDVEVTNEGKLKYDDDLARKFTGRMALLPDAEQMRAYAHIIPAYNDLVSQLKATGEYDLDIVVHDDWDGRPISDEVLSAGTDESNFFTSSVRHQQWEVRDTRHVPTGKEMQTEFQSKLGGREKFNASVADFARATLDRLRSMRTEYQQVIAANPDIKNPANRDASLALTRVDASLLRFNSMTLPVLRQLTENAGRVIELVNSETGEVYRGALVDAKLPDNTKQIRVSPSALRLKFLVNSPGGTIHMTGLDLFKDNKFKIESTHGVSFDELVPAAADARYVRHFITGNPIAAYDATGQKGKMVRFKSQDGQTITGLLMPHNWTPKDLVHDPRMELINGRAVANFLRDENSVNGTTLPVESDVARMYRRGQSEYVISVPAANRTGGFIYRDERLTKLTGDFRKVGNRFLVEIPAEKVARAAELINDLTKRRFKAATIGGQNEPIAQRVAVANGQPSRGRGERGFTLNPVQLAVENLRSLLAEKRPVQADETENDVRSIVRDSVADGVKDKTGLYAKFRKAFGDAWLKLRSIIDRVWQDESGELGKSADIEGNADEWKPVGKNDKGQVIYGNAKGERSLIIDGKRVVKPGPKQAAAMASMPEEAPVEKRTTGIKNAVVNKERVARGLEPMPQPETESERQSWSEAVNIAENDPLAGRNLTARILENPRRALEPWENDLLLHDRMKIQNDQYNELKTINNPEASQDDVIEAQYRLAALDDAMDANDQAAKLAGTASGRSLQARKKITDEDFSLVALRNRKRAANGGELTAEQEAEILDLHKKLVDLQKKLDDYQAGAEQRIADSDARASDLEAELKKMRQRVNRGNDAEPPKPTGPGGGSPPKERTDLINAIRGQVSAGRPLDSLGSWIQKLAEQFVREGVNERGALVRAVHGVLLDILPDVTERETMDAISGYGQFHRLNKDAVKVELRDLKGQMQQVAKLEDMENGVAPLKTGVERRSPSDAERQLVALVNEAKKRGGYEVTDPETQLASAQQSRLTFLRNRITDLKQEISTKTPIVKDRLPTPTTPEVEKLKAEYQKLRQERAELFNTMLVTYKNRTAKRIQDLEKRLAAKDFGARKRPEPPKIKMDAEGLRLQADLERAKARFKGGLIADRLKNRTGVEKVEDALVRWRRGFVLSGPATLAKLTAAAVFRLSLTPIEEATGSLLSRLPGVSRVAARAPRQSGMNVKAESKALTEAFTTGLRDAWDILRTGRGNLDVVYGKGREQALGEFNEDQHSIIDFFGHVHGALKAPVKRAEFARSFEKRVAWSMENGIDVTDPMVQTRIAMDAYKDAERAIFLQDNAVTDAYKRALSRGYQVDKATGKADPTWRGVATGARVLMPITKVPTNIVGETIEYATGALTGSYRLAQALRGEVEKLPPDQADMIMRKLKKGSLGGMGLLLGFLLAASIGGYYQHGKKRDPQDVKSGGMRIGDFDVAKNLLHHPFLETLQIGATVRRVADSKLRKRDEETQGVRAGLAAGGLGLIEEVPFIREMLEVYKAFQPNERGQFVGELSKSLVVPQLVQWMAMQSDKDEEGKVNRRKPDSEVDHIKTGIPGLRQTVPLKE